MTHYEYLSDTEPTEIKDPDDYFSPAVSHIDESNLKQLAKDMKTQEKAPAKSRRFDLN